jgi:hypothetical protein
VTEDLPIIRYRNRWGVECEVHGELIAPAIPVSVDEAVREYLGRVPTSIPSAYLSATEAAFRFGWQAALAQTPVQQWRAIEGWVLVPKEPTDDMLDSICCSMGRIEWLVHARQAWDAALLSAPSPKDKP